MKRAPTLNDVAKLAKVSRSLVSLVFQDSPKVSPEKRAAVLKAAAKLGYQPNESARRLKSSVTKTIGVVLTDIHNPYYGEIFYGVENAGSESDYKLLIGNAGFESDDMNQRARIMGARQLDTVKTVRSQMVDGLVCSSLRTQPDDLFAAIGSTPLVLIGHTNAALAKRYDVVITDEQDAARQIVNHLVDLGHKRITHISGGTDVGPAERSKKFLAEMKKQGLQASAEVIEGSWSQEAGYNGTEEILNGKVLPTAIYAANDLIAMGVLAKLRERKIRVPEDISVIGFDDTTLAKLKIADITSVKEPLFSMGRTAFELLIERIDGAGKPFTPKFLKIKPHLVTRTSTGPRKKASK